MHNQQQAKSVLKQFRIIFGAVKQHFRNIEATCGISGSQLWLLNEIAMYPELGISKLAERLAIHQSTCSLLVEKLVKRKLVEKQRQQDDQRKVGLMITQSGKDMLAKAPQPVDGILPQLLAELNEHQLSSLEGSLNIIISKLADEHQRLAEQPLADM